MAIFRVDLDTSLTVDQARKRFETERNVLITGLGVLLVAIVAWVWFELSSIGLVFLGAMIAFLLMTLNLKMLDAKVSYMHALMRDGSL